MPQKTKTYYYCQLFFEYYNNPVILNILRRRNGAEIIVLHQKLVMLTANSDNIYRYMGDDNDADHADELACMLRMSASSITEGLTVLYQHGLIEKHQEGIYVPILPQLIMVGSITSEGLKKRKTRSKKALPEPQEDTREDNVPPKIDKKLDLISSTLVDDDKKAFSIINIYNATFGTHYHPNNKNLKTVKNALRSISTEQAEQIIANEFFLFSQNTNRFSPNITWMFGTGLAECVARIKNKNRKIGNAFNNFPQRDYDFAEIEKENDKLD